MTERCYYYEQSRRQRATEVVRGDGLEGTDNYVKVGCLGDCDGYDESCSKYRAERGVVINLLEEGARVETETFGKCNWLLCFMMERLTTMVMRMR